MATITIDPTETLPNICIAAAERFVEHAATMRATGGKYARIAEQFERQAAEARRMAEVFAAGDPFALTYDAEEAAPMWDDVTTMADHRHQALRCAAAR